MQLRMRKSELMSALLGPAALLRFRRFQVRREREQNTARFTPAGQSPNRREHYLGRVLNSRGRLEGAS